MLVDFRNLTYQLPAFSARKPKPYLLFLGALSLAGGALLGIGFLAPSLWPLSLIGIAPLCAVAADQRLSWRSTMLLGWLAGFAVYGLAVFGVYWHALPVAWLPRDEFAFQFAFVLINWTLTSAAMGLAAALWSAVVRFVSTDTWLDIISAAAAWVLSEVVAAYLGLLLNYGPGSIIGPHFTLGSVGYQLANDTALLQAAWLGGVYALSAVAILTGAIFYRIAVTKRAKERRALCVVLVAGILIWGGGRFLFALYPVGAHAAAAQAVPNATFAVVATRLEDGSYDPEANLDQQLGLLRRSAGADVAVLPEGSELFAKLHALGGPMPDSARLYVDSSDVQNADGALQTRADYYDARSGTTTASTYKRFLLPFGEYIPYLYSRGFFANTASFRDLAALGTYTPGAMPGVVATPSGANIGVLFCDEALSPTMYRALALRGANVLVNVSSQLWFNQSRTVFAQMQHAAAVRAVESRRWFVDASNATPAFVLDEYGRIVGETPWDSTGVMRLPVPLLEGRTPYGTYGMYALLVPLFALAYAAWRRMTQGRPRHRG